MDFGRFYLILVVVIGNWHPFYYFRLNSGGHRSHDLYLDFVYFDLGYLVNHDLVRNVGVLGEVTDHVTFSALVGEETKPGRNLREAGVEFFAFFLLNPGVVG